MSMTDPIADMLTRIRNANAIRREKVDVPFSKVKESILAVLKEEGYIRDVLIFGEGKLKTLRVALKYGPNKESIINSLKRESKPGRRFYVRVDQIKPVMNGLGVAVLSTPKGIMSDRRCRSEKVGGELMVTVC